MLQTSSVCDSSISSKLIAAQTPTDFCSMPKTLSTVLQSEKEGKGAGNATQRPSTDEVIQQAVRAMKIVPYLNHLDMEERLAT